MTTGLDLITDSLIDIGALRQGETVPDDKAQFALRKLNRMLDQWSNSPLMVFYRQEIVYPLSANLSRYAVGGQDEVNNAIFLPIRCDFTGQIIGNRLLVSAVTSGALTPGMYLGDPTSSGLVVANQRIAVQLNGLTPGGTGEYRLTLTQPNVPSQAFRACYSRPIRLNNAFVRVATLDYPVSIMNEENWSMIGQKDLQGPWPRAMYFQPTEPFGTLLHWPVPASGEMHVFADMLLSGFTALDVDLKLPQGYDAAIEWSLAELLMPSYGKSDPLQVQMVKANAAAGQALIKRTNMAPQQSVAFDTALLPRGSVADAGWYLNGGFR